MKNLIPTLCAAVAVSMCVGCASTWHHEMKGKLVQPGPYAGVRTDLKLIGSLPGMVKTAQGGDKVAMAMCVPFGTALIACDIPLSLVADTYALPGDIKTNNQ